MTFSGPRILTGRFITESVTCDHAQIRLDSHGVIESIEPVSEAAPITTAPATPASITTAGAPREGTVTTLAASDRITWVPGFVDLHNHGGNGGAFPTGELQQCRAAAAYHRAAGTTTLLASTVSAARDDLLAQLDILTTLCQERTIDGIHLEGPFVNACRCGAQNPAAIIDGDPKLFAELLDAGAGHIVSMTFAPETPHARELVSMCARHHVIASLGHTDASAHLTRSILDHAREVGATVTATHLFNAMPPLHHRRPGAAAALVTAASAGEVFVELVADGTHLDHHMVDMVWAAAPNNAMAITDAMEAAGLEDGEYILGALDVQVRGGVARLATQDGSAGAIAGGTSTLLDQFHAFRARHGVHDAVRFTSANARAVLEAAGQSHAGATTAEHGGVAEHNSVGPGSLLHCPAPEVGQPARLVGLNPDGTIAEVIRA